MRRFILSVLSAAILVFTAGGCTWWDYEGPPCDSNRTVTCRLRMVVNVDSQLLAQLPADRDSVLRMSLSDYFTRMVHPSSLLSWMGFYDMSSGALSRSCTTVVQSSGSTITLSLPEGDLRLIVCPKVDMLGDTTLTSTARLAQIGKDSITGRSDVAYTGRLNMPDGKDSYTITLYPADAQLAVVAKTDQTIRSVRMSVEGLYTTFLLNDSVYSSQNQRPVSLPLRIATENNGRQVYAATVFPTQGGTRADDSNWQITVYATTATGSVTRSILTPHPGFKAGEIRIIQVSIGANGAVETTDASVGASITLDWKPGGTYNPEI